MSVRAPWLRRAAQSTRWALLAYVPPAILVVRRRRAWRLPQPLSLALAWGVPLAVAAALPRGRARAVAAWSAHMWAYKIVFEVPYDRPERLRSRLHIDAPIMADSVLGLGEPPGERMQRRLRHPPQLNAIDRTLTFVYALWEAEPHAGLAWILARHPERFPEAALRLGATFDMTLLGYLFLPSAPPWWASEREGRMGRAVRRVTTEVGKELKGDLRPGIDHNAGANPWAAMPSDHFAAAVSTATLLWRPTGAWAQPVRRTRRCSASPSSTRASITSPTCLPAPRSPWASTSSADRRPGLRRVLRSASPRRRRRGGGCSVADARGPIRGTPTRCGSDG